VKGMAGTGTLAHLILRRDRALLPVWVLLLAVAPAAFAATFADLYPTAAERQAFAEMAGSNPGLLALFGPVFDSSVGGLTAWRVSILLTVVALISALTVVRHTRTEEEAGRRELVGSTVVGRHAPLAAALIVTVVANIALAALLALGLIVQDLPAGGAIAFGLAFATAGCVFAAVAAVAAQLVQGAGAARGLAIGALGLAFLLRVAGDVGGEEGEVSWLSWLSPIGWAMQTRPFASERWWVFALAAGAFVALTTAAYALSSRRDIGAGLLPPRDGPATASPRLRSPLALAWRLHRGLLVGWTAGFAAVGAVVGGVTETVSEMFTDNPQLQAIFEGLGGQAGLTNVYLSAVVGFLGLAAAGYAVQAVLRLRSEETEARAEPVLTTAVGRSQWAVGHLLFALAGPAVALAAFGLVAGLVYGASIGDVRGELPRVLAGAVVQLPAVWVLVGIAIAFFGLLPRLVSLSWAALAIFALLGQFGEVLQLDKRLLNISPFAHLPALPGGEVSAAPLVWLVVVAAVLAAAGLIGFRRRDVS
jgi:ABC-2 type transport system permease protein